MPFLNHYYKLKSIVDFTDTDTEEPLDVNIKYYFLKVPYIDISEVINFEQSLFSFSNDEKGIYNKSLREELPNFKKEDYLDWILNFDEKLKNKTVNKVMFIERLTL